MFPLLESIKVYIGEVFWRRSSGYKNRSHIKTVEETDSAIIFLGTVKGTTQYHLELRIEKPDGILKAKCSCLSFRSNNRCKHIGGFAKKIAEIYTITSEITLKSSQSNSDRYTENTSNSTIQKYKIDPDILSTLPASMEDYMLKYFMQNYPEFLIEKTDISPRVSVSPLDILAEISPPPRVLIPDEKYIRVAVEELRNTHTDQNDLVISLYQQKIQKNGKLSIGKKIYKNEILDKKFQNFFPFLEERNYNYYRWGNSSNNQRLSFGKAPEYFVQLLSGAKDILTNSSNQPLIVKTGLCELRISVEKKQKNKEFIYTVTLVLEDKLASHTTIPLKNQVLYHANESKYFAYVSNGTEINFFQTEIPAAFVFSLYKNDVTLTEAEWKQLMVNPIFEHLLKYTNDISFLEEQTKMGSPELFLELAIDPDFQNIVVHYRIVYDAKVILPNDETKYFVNENIVVRRNFEQEKNELTKISSLFSQADSHETELCCLSKKIDDTSDQLFDTIEGLISDGMRVEYRQTTKRVSSKALTAKLDVTSGEDWFDLNVVFSIGDQEIKKSKEILGAMKRGGKYITLDDGTVILLKNEVQKTLNEWDELGITEKNIENTIKIGKYSIGLLREKSKGGFSEFQLSKEVAQLKKSLNNFSGIKKYPLPEAINVTLRDYQNVGYNWLRFLQEYGFSGILADDMGLGKTIQTLVFLQSEHNKPTTDLPSIIVVPTSLVLNWMDEAKKFVPKLRIQYIKDGKTGFSDIRKNTQIIIVSYGIIANLIEKNEFEKQKFYYVILDEAQNIKNLTAARTKSVLKLRAKHRLALSGTPIENNLLELFSIFNFLMPGFIGSEASFREKYIKGDAENLEILSRKVKPFILRRKKEEVLKELPAKQEEVIYLEMESEQKQFYESLKTAYKVQISKKITEDGLAKSHFAVLDALLKLRQACLMPRLVKIDKIPPNASIKLQYIEENIEEMINTGHNLLIFSQFTGFLAFVQQIFDQKKIPFHYLDGSTKREDRKKLVDSFNAGTVPVFLISLKAGGTGLNLTGADYVIHLDPWWNPAVENQATDRAHRMGQTKTVFVQKLIVRDTVEEKILKLQVKKKKLVDDLFSGDFHGTLSEADIGYIFE